MTRPRLDGLPEEVLQNVYRFVDPTDLLAISLSSRHLQKCMHHNETLFKAILFEQLDSPVRIGYGIKPGPWDIYIQNTPIIPASALYKEKGRSGEGEFKRFLKFVNVLECDDNEIKRQNLEFITQAAAKYLRAASSIYSTTLPRITKYFNNKSNRDMLLCQSTVFARVRGNEWHTTLPGPEQQAVDAKRNLSAKLHCLYGVPIEAIGRTRSKRTYPFACAKVYDIRNYTSQTRWGPFLGDGSGMVDWEMMEAIMLVIGHNVRSFGRVRNNEFCKRLWTRPWAGAVPYSYVDKEINIGGALPFTDEQKELIARDPYGVTGTWMRVVCFLDYTEFFAYNFANPVPIGAPRQPVETEEATRYIIMELTVTKIEPPGLEDEPPLGRQWDDGPLPVVYFSGTSRSMHQSWDPNANANLRGTVRMTPEGEIRWTTSSVYFGEERWRSESIQVGGIRSARGAIGNWFDKDLDPHGPVGPTAFWKVSDKILESREEVEALAREDPEVPGWATDADEEVGHDVDAQEDDEEEEEEDDAGNGSLHFAPNHFISILEFDEEDDEEDDEDFPDVGNHDVHNQGPDNARE